MDLTERLRASITQARAIDRSELLAEAADAIERLNKEVSILIAECQAMVDRCVNGPLVDRSSAGVRFSAVASRETGPLCSEAAAYTGGIPASGESKPTLTDAERTNPR